MNGKHLVLTMNWLVAFSAGVICQPALGQSTATQWQPELFAVVQANGDTDDQSKLRDMLHEEFPHNRFGGISAIEWTGQGDEYWVLADRGPLDGAVEYHCRLHRIRLKIGQPESPSMEVLETVMLVDQQGTPFVGSSSHLGKHNNEPRRLDPEGLRIDAEGNFLISDEYGPYLMRFDRHGKLTDELPVPSEWRIERASGNSDEEDSLNAKGRRSNRGMEGLAITPSGQAIVGLLQSALLQDAQRSSSGKATGFNTRMLWIDLQTGQQRQFVFRQEQPEYKLHEILAINETDFLLIEQDGKVGQAARYKKIIRISLVGASEISPDAQLPPGDLPASICAAAKLPYLDLLAPQFGLAGPAMPEKIEGLCWGPTLPDGRRLLVVVTDNDFEAKQPTQFWVFAMGG